jgi:hypothetical protein
MVLDAKRQRDGEIVCVKCVEPKRYVFDPPDEKIPRTNETKIARYLSSEQMLRHPTNHCVPILDYFEDPVDPDVEYIVMPALRPFNDPEFRFVGEVVDFVTQLLEVGILLLFHASISLVPGTKFHASPSSRASV